MRALGQVMGRGGCSVRRHQSAQGAGVIGEGEPVSQVCEGRVAGGGGL